MALILLISFFFSSSFFLFFLFLSFFSQDSQFFSLFLGVAEMLGGGGGFGFVLLFSLASISKMHLMHIISTSLFTCTSISLSFNQANLLVYLLKTFLPPCEVLLAGHLCPWEANLASFGSQVGFQLNGYYSS